MSRSLQQLFRMARSVKMTATQREAQRQSFAYGNAHIENPRVTRKTVAQESARLKKRA